MYAPNKATMNTIVTTAADVADTTPSVFIISVGAIGLGVCGSLIAKKSWPAIMGTVVGGGLYIWGHTAHGKTTKQSIIKALAKHYNINAAAKTTDESLSITKPAELPASPKPPASKLPQIANLYPSTPKLPTLNDNWPGVGAKNMRNLVPRAMDPDLQKQAPIPMPPVVTADVGPHGFDTSDWGHMPTPCVDYPLLVRRPEVAVFTDETDERMRWFVGGLPPATNETVADLPYLNKQ